jgi:hypothetical protein
MTDRAIPTAWARTDLRSRHAHPDAGGGLGKPLSPARPRRCIEHVRAKLGVPGPGAASLDAEKGAGGPCRRGGTDRRHRSGHAARPLRLPPDHGDAPCGGLGGEREAALEGALKEREADTADGELAAAGRRIGELSMGVELPRAKMERAAAPLAREAGGGDGRGGLSRCRTALRHRARLSGPGLAADELPCCARRRGAGSGGPLAAIQGTRVRPPRCCRYSGIDAGSTKDADGGRRPPPDA